MKNLIKAILILTAFPLIGMASAGPVNLVNEAGLSYGTTYPMNLNAPLTGGNKLAVQVTWSTGNTISKTFTDGTQSTGSIIVATNNILAVAATNTITVPTSAAILGSPATAQITVISTSGLTGACLTLATNSNYVFCNGGVGGWTGVSTTSGTAQNIAASMNGIGGILAQWGGGTSAVIYTTNTAVGFAGNSYIVGTSTPTAISTTTFSGGKDRALQSAYFTINGVKFINGYHWSDQSNTSTGTAISISAVISTRQVILSTTNGVSSVIYTTATTPGAAGNSFTFGSSTPTLVFGSTNFKGGQDAASVTVNGVLFTAGVNYTTGTTAQTATSLAAAITAASATGVTAAAVGTLVTATSTINGIATNYSLTSSTDAALTLSGPKTITSGASISKMTGGTSAGFILNSAVINVPSHGFTKAMPILYSGTPAIGGLATGTTYFSVIVDSNNIMLSSTTVVALTGTGIVITSSSSQTTAHTYTLAPLAYTAGSAGGQWQVSNDGINYVNLLTTSGNITVPAQTFTAVFPSSTSVQDFGPIDYGYLQYKVTAPSAGALSLKVIVNTKD